MPEYSHDGTMRRTDDANTVGFLETKTRPARSRNGRTALETAKIGQGFGPRLLSGNRGKPAAETLDDTLSSALLAQDKELASILHEVEKVSKSLKPDAPHHLALSRTLQRTVLCALKQSLLDKELRSLALTDDLTCLYNRRAFLALATQQLRVARRKDERLLLFFMDLDGLKNINDSFGHREGDLALVRTADALEQTFRDSDIVARLGGDEFSVLALEASSRDEEVILHRLRTSLRNANATESRYQMSLSVGVARFDPKHSVSLGELLSQADQAMFEKKRKHPKFSTSRT
jgi:diguanylate cyclase (GGDEF)-like protein